MKNFTLDNTQKHAFFVKITLFSVDLTKSYAIMYMDEIGEKIQFSKVRAI